MVSIPTADTNCECARLLICAGLQASQFVRTPEFVSAKHTTMASGISSLLPKATIDDFVFDPCGYSMNGLEGSAFSTIHITPENGFSYASLEMCGYCPKSADPTAVVAKVCSSDNVICVLYDPMYAL